MAGHRDLRQALKPIHWFVFYLYHIYHIYHIHVKKSFIIMLPPSFQIMLIMMKYCWLCWRDIAEVTMMMSGGVNSICRRRLSTGRQVWLESGRANYFQPHFETKQVFCLRWDLFILLLLLCNKRSYCDTTKEWMHVDLLTAPTRGMLYLKLSVIQLWA